MNAHIVDIYNCDSYSIRLMITDLSDSEQTRHKVSVIKSLNSRKNGGVGNSDPIPSDEVTINDLVGGNDDSDEEVIGHSRPSYAAIKKLLDGIDYVYDSKSQINYKLDELCHELHILYKPCLNDIYDDFVKSGIIYHIDGEPMIVNSLDGIYDLKKMKFVDRLKECRYIPNIFEKVQ